MTELFSIKPDRYKKIITDYMSFLADEGTVWFYGVVIKIPAVRWQQVGDAAAALGWAYRRE